MKPYTPFTELFLNHEIAEISDCLNLLLKIAMTTDNGFFEQVADRESAYLVVDNVVRTLHEARPLWLADQQAQRAFTAVR